MASILMWTFCSISLNMTTTRRARRCHKTLWLCLNTQLLSEILPASSAFQALTSGVTLLQMKDLMRDELFVPCAPCVRRNNFGEAAVILLCQSGVARCCQ